MADQLFDELNRLVSNTFVPAGTVLFRRDEPSKSVYVVWPALTWSFPQRARTGEVEHSPSLAAHGGKSVEARTGQRQCDIHHNPVGPLSAIIGKTTERQHCGPMARIGAADLLHSSEHCENWEFLWPRNRKTILKP